MIQESETRRNARVYAGEQEEEEEEERRGEERKVVAGEGEDGRTTRTTCGCIDWGMRREPIEGEVGQVRVAEQIYWIQGGCKSGGISVTKERCLLV